MAEFTPQIHPWNQPIWEQLAQEGGRRNHALLFNGQVGLGKLDLAMALAQRVISHQNERSASLFAAGSHPDMHVLMPESELHTLEEGDIKQVYTGRYLEPHTGKPKQAISIDSVRKLSAALTTRPHISKHRVILIAHAQQLNRNAANALLKNLEEPPSQTLFILVTDDVSSLPKTIRSRCSLVNFRAPTYAVAKAWLEQQSTIPASDIDSHLAMANNQPLHALQLFNDGYIEALKSVFNDVNGLWSRRRLVVDTAKDWQTTGSVVCVEILQKLCADLLRCKVSDQPINVFFPVQQSWVKSSAKKISANQLVQTIDALSEARRLLNTAVDDLLVMETVSIHVRRMPQSA